MDGCSNAESKSVCEGCGYFCNVEENEKTVCLLGNKKYQDWKLQVGRSESCREKFHNGCVCAGLVLTGLLLYV